MFVEIITLCIVLWEGFRPKTWVPLFLSFSFCFDIFGSSVVVVVLSLSDTLNEPTQTSISSVLLIVRIHSVAKPEEEKLEE